MFSGSVATTVFFIAAVSMRVFFRAATRRKGSARAADAPWTPWSTTVLPSAQSIAARMIGTTRTRPPRMERRAGIARTGTRRRRRSTVTSITLTARAKLSWRIVTGSAFWEWLSFSHSRLRGSRCFRGTSGHTPLSLQVHQLLFHWRSCFKFPCLRVVMHGSLPRQS